MALNPTSSKTDKWRSPVRAAITIAGWGAIGVLVPHVFGSGPATLLQLEYILALMMVASGLNIVLGFAGQLFLGPSALVATGGYAAAVFATHFRALQSFPAMLVISIVGAVVLGAITAIPALRIGGFYLGMVTLFAALVVPDVAGQLKITGGGGGISLLTDPSFNQHPSGMTLYYLGLLLVALMAGYAWLIKASRLGRRFGALMASEELAQAVGIQPYRAKLLAFMLSAVPCGVAGAFYVYSQQFISPDSVGTTMSITILAGMVIGGGGTLLGPLIGTALVGSASQFLGSFEKYQGLVYGVALILAATSLPFGLIGLYKALLIRYRMRRVGEFPLVEPAPAPTFSEPVPPDAVLASDSPQPTVPLVVTGVSRRFGGVLALDDVDLEVAPGRVHALVGPNGSGKTTLINLVSGYYRVDSGTITLGDHLLHNMKAAQIASLGVARTFQTPKMLVANPVIDNVVVAADRSARGSLVGTVFHTRTARSEAARSRLKAAAALDQTGIGSTSGTLAELIPHGMQRLLEIARAKALDPAFVMLDEPAAGLSGAEVKLLSRAVKDMAAAGLGVLIVEHNLPVVFGLADDVTVLHQGRVIARGSPEQVAQDPEVVRVYLGRQGQSRGTPPTVRSPAPSASSTEPRP